MEAPKFTESYNVGKKLCTEYKHFIEKLRSKPQLTVRKVQNCNVLPKEAAPIQYFHIKLQANQDTNNDTKTLELKIQFHDLYLVAFKTKSEKWFCFKDRMLPGAESLGVKANYMDSLDTTMIGWKPFINAIHYLENYTKKMGKAEEHAKVLMVMICEAIRFNKIGNTLIADLLHESKNDAEPYGHTQINQKQLGIKDSNLIRNWGDISEAMLKYHSQIGKKGVFPDSFTSFGIKTFDDATNTLSMLKFIE